MPTRFRWPFSPEFLRETRKFCFEKGPMVIEGTTTRSLLVFEKAPAVFLNPAFLNVEV